MRIESIRRHFIHPNGRLYSRCLAVLIQCALPCQKCLCRHQSTTTAADGGSPLARAVSTVDQCRAEAVRQPPPLVAAAQPSGWHESSFRDGSLSPGHFGTCTLRTVGQPARPPLPSAGNQRNQSVSREHGAHSSRAGRGNADGTVSHRFPPPSPPPPPL